MFEKQVNIAEKFDSKERIVVHQGDCLGLLRQIPNSSTQAPAPKEVITNSFRRPLGNGIDSGLRVCTLFKCRNDKYACLSPKAAR